MMLLHIDSSILGAESVSRMLSAEIVAHETLLHPGIEIVYRDLAADPALHLSDVHVAARAGESVKGAVLCSDIETGQDYVAELFGADIIVMGAPMYNFSIPSQLKAWIDRIVVAGVTFEYSETGEPQTLLPPHKKIIIASTCGDFYSSGTAAAASEHHDSYLRRVFSFLGLRDVTIVRAEGLASGPGVRSAAIKKARSDIATIEA